MGNVNEANLGTVDTRNAASASRRKRRVGLAIRRAYMGETASAIPLMTPQRCMKVSQS